MTSASHEQFNRPDDVQVGSERSFGIVFAVFCAVVGGLKLWNGHSWGPWWLAASATFLVLAFVWTAPLRPLNRLWFKFALLLHRIVNPVVMALLFFATVTPMALLIRIVGKDLLNLKRDPEARSYWIERRPPGPAPDTMKNQF